MHLQAPAHGAIPLNEEADDAAIVVPPEVQHKRVGGVADCEVCGHHTSGGQRGRHEPVHGLPVVGQEKLPEGWSSRHDLQGTRKPPI